MSAAVARAPGRIATAAALLAAAAVLAPAARAGETRMAAAVTGDVALSPELAGHGALLVAADFSGPVVGFVVFDTETLRAGVDRVRLAEGLWLGAEAVGEYGFASLLPDYHLDGVRVPERGFAASYLGGVGRLTWSPHAEHWFRVQAGGRRWFFAALDATDSALTLPARRGVGELSADYTFWRMNDGDDFSWRQRAFPRVNGLAFGVGIAAWINDDDAAWGALDASAFEPVDPRNDADRVAYRPHVWLRAGTNLHPRLRWQVDHRAAWGVGEDDLTRARIGGLSRYVVPLAGAPWGALVSERFVSGQWSWHARVAADHELGLLLDGVAVDDPHRTGASQGGVLFGGAVFADLRFGGWQLDARAGWTPSLHPGSEGVAVLLGAGWGGVVSSSLDRSDRTR